MKLIATIRSIDDIDLIKEKADAIVIANKHLSSRYDYAFDTEQIKLIAKKASKYRMECYILANDIFSDETLKKAIEVIEELQELNLFYIFGDYGLYEYFKNRELTKKLVYMPDTLVTNYVDYTFLKELKIRGAFPSLEITADDVAIIGKNKKVKMYYKGFGRSVMFHSKRPLLTLYKTYKNVPYDFTRSFNNYLIEETRKEKYAIVENEHGTHIFQTGVHNVLPALDVFVNELDYLFIDGTYLDYEKYMQALDIYNEALLDLDHLNLYNKRLKEVFSDLTYDFVYEDSVFRKEDF